MSSEREKSDRGGERYGGRRKSFFSLAVVVELSLILDLKACAHLGPVEVGWTCARSGRHVPRRCAGGAPDRPTTQTSAIRSERSRLGCIQSPLPAREGDGSETCFHGVFHGHVWTCVDNVWQSFPSSKTILIYFGFH